MANTYKNIVITPNRDTAENVVPTITFSGGDTTSNTDITLRVYTTSNGTLSFEGTAGQLFSITNDLTNSIFSVNDVSGIPSIDVYANGNILLAPFGGQIFVGNTANLNFDSTSSTKIVKPVANTLAFHTDQTERVRIHGSGKVGIGTVDPSTALHVVGRITSESESPLIYLRDSVAVNATQYTGYIDFRDSTDTRAGYIGFGSTNTPDFYMYASDPSGNIRFHSGGTTERMRIAASGNVLIGRTTDSTIGSSVKLDVNGAINAAALLVNNGSAVLNNATTLITVGYNVATYNASANIAAFGTWQPNPSNGNYQVARCNGAVTIVTPPANSAIDILFINSVRRNPGAVTFSGYSVGTYTGTTYDVTTNNKFILSIRELEGVATYSWYALQ